ncbi:ABC transporter permease [Leucobacter luti]|uniref:Peptide/nickel transport system permease protein n=1 Tax=Leucobacter luti TaxID=340320 RepID=A0A4Q7U0Z8_9MICO|nr:ABC transporter permease [Leucobacter luti]MBL3699542.1 ABC transporter permease [Leucobacter luti]RZT67054.1 peptide/nickel transport system permease protein [Leucobacter luti]
MWPSILRRVGYGLLVVLLVTFSVSLLLSFAPGSVAQTILGDEATPENVAALNAALGYDRPFLVQYFDWLWHAVQGDLGTSPITHIPVMQSIAERIPVTLEIAVLALIISLAISVPLAIVSASRPGGSVDRTISAITSVFLSVPAFVAGPVLIYFFAVSVNVFPALGWVPIGESLGGNLRAAFLPALAAAITEIAAFHRVLRADLISTLNEDYVAAARAKGLSSRYVMFRHAFRPSSFSLLTISGLSLARLIGGTIIVEMLFVLPGLGQYIANAVTTNDIVAVQGVVAFIALVFVVMNMLVDVSYGLVDPRVRRAPSAKKTRRPKSQEVAA